MPKIFPLVVKHGVLHFPHGGADFNVSFDSVESIPSMLIRSYTAGHSDSIPFPLRDADDVRNLARALFDERKSNPYFPADAIIELPDGTEFDFESIAAADPSIHEEEQVDPGLAAYLATNRLDPDLLLDPASADPVIREMIAHPGPVIADICVAKDENCFPMIPSGAAHNEMILGPDQEKNAAAVTDEGKVLV